MQRKMEDLRLNCLKEIPIQAQKADSAMSSLLRTLKSIKITAKTTAENQAKLHKLKDYLMKLEDDFAKTVAVKTSKETDHEALLESLSAAKARTKVLNKQLQDQKVKKDEFATIISQQLLSVATIGEASNEAINQRKGLEDVISWYNRVLGFRIEAGHGIKFIFYKIDSTNPDKEYSFTIRHWQDTYTLLDCDPYLDGTKELLQELNRTNGLFKFIRVMREKFQVAATLGLLHQVSATHLDSTVIVSSLASSNSVKNRNASLPQHQELQVDSSSGLDKPQKRKKVNHGRAAKPATPSPESSSSRRQSSRLKVLDPSMAG